VREEPLPDAPQVQNRLKPGESLEERCSQLGITYGHGRVDGQRSQIRTTRRRRYLTLFTAADNVSEIAAWQGY
jgi:hypothetical protein